MPVILTLPSTPSSPYFDQVRVYKRLTSTSFTLLSTELIGTVSYTDPAGLINDEYHTTFYSSTLLIESLPSNIYRALTPWKQDMGVILELQTTCPDPTVDTVAIYKRKYGLPDSVRIGTVAIGTQYYSDPDGLPGDEYHTTFIDSLTLSESQPGPSVIADANSGVVVVSGIAINIKAKSISTGAGYPDDPFSPSPHVHVTLLWPSRHITPSANGQAVVRETIKAPIGANGMWSIPLVPNDLLQAPDSYYEFKFTDGVVYFKRVNSINGLAQNFSLLGDVDPLELR